MLCVELDAQGVVRAVDPQPATYTECSMVVQSGAAVASSPWNLTVEEGALIGGAIAGLWVLVGAIRVVRERL